MSEQLKLTNRQARRFILAQQGLWPPQQLAGKADILDYITRVGCVQYDPLDVVGRNPELVLQARVADYRPALLEELLYEERALLDGWDKNMSIYPVEDWPHWERRREKYRHNPGRSKEAVEAALPTVLQAVAERGPLSSLEIDLGKTVDWAWAPTRLARAALESAYFRGDLIVHHKVHTRKVYDLTERHLPERLLAAPDPHETTEAYHDWYVRRRVGSVGLLWDRSGGAWLAMGAIKSRERKASLARLLARGEVIPAEVEGLAPQLYLRAEDRPRLEAVLNGTAPEPQAALIAPLDNLIWDRTLIQELFGFEYIWEVYKPVAERQYGYYVLPVLYGDRFVARFEPVQVKENGVLRIKQWWWEPGVEVTEAMRVALKEAFADFLRYLQIDELQVGEAAAAEGIGWLAFP